MLKKIFLAIFVVLNKFIFGLVRLGVATIYFIRRRFLWIVHALIFLYAFKHIHLLDDPQTFQAIGADERKHQFRAVLLLIGLIAFWLWEFGMAIWTYDWSKKNVSVESPYGNDKNDSQ